MTSASFIPVPASPMRDALNHADGATESGSTTDNGPRIAIVCQLPFTEIDHPKAEVMDILARGIGIDVVDVSRVLYPSYSTPAREYTPPVGVTVHKIQSTAELVRVERLLRAASLIICFVSSGHIGRRTRQVMRVISEVPTPYMLIVRGAHPIIDPDVVHRTFVQRVRQIDIVNSVLNRIPLSLLGVRLADYVVWGGDASRVPLRLVGERTREVWSFAENFKTYRDELAARPVAPEKKIAVYLDQYFGFHPDAAVRGPRFALNPDTIYPRLRRLFDRIEAERGLEVVIAAHPRANYDDKPGIYGARQIVRGRTVGLVRESQLVICAYSTAASYAVLFGRPLLVVTTPEISNVRALPAAPEALARSIGTTAHDLSEPDEIDLSAVGRPDSPYYKNYTERFVVSARSAGIGIAEIVARICAERGSAGRRTEVPV